MTTRAQQAEQTRRAVVDTARGLFLQHGYDATSLQLIADTMGVTKANVYYYFKTKAEILEAITEVSQASLNLVFDEAETIVDRAARQAFVIDSFVDLVVLQRAIAPNQGDPGLRRQERIAASMEQLSRRGLELLFGPEPTLDEQVGYHLVSDLGPLLQHFPDLPDDELRDALRRLCRRLLP